MKRTSQGFSLIEVLVAVLVVSIGLLGIASTLLTATSSATSSYVRQQAVQYTYDILERMRANASVAHDPTSGNPYIVAAAAAGSAPSPNCSTATCTPAQMAAFDVWQWQSGLQADVPGGLGSVAVSAGTDNTTIVTITVTWSDQPAQTTLSRGTLSSTSTLSTPTYTVTTAL
ncbi:type IV pilus modification protein PilV [Dyella silvatica]|uniref:type IV pilus modification protein PilV n=1 Tax=Dyella silvatica TaxID=2992128 RepID=UPI0022546B93|nr:type IV pilus modification protein PilV [Dyella silvatica]